MTETDLMLNPMRCFVVFILSLLLCVPVFSQISINEACSYNCNLIEDEDEDESDWIELYNAGSVAVSLQGYSIADSKEIKWYFPDTSLAPGAFLLIFASGKNRFQPFIHTDFKLSADGDWLVLYNPSGSATDSLILPALQPDHSFGNKNDGQNHPSGIFLHPTPGTTNQFESLYTGYTPDPVLSLKHGFYPNPVTLSASYAASSEKCYYTTDGSEPTPDDSLFVSPLVIDETTVLRVRSYNTDTLLLPSLVKTSTYFIGYTSHLPVFSISTHPDHLWDADSGIYVLGNHADTAYPYYGANFWQDWEVPAHIEFFETNGRMVLEQDLGLSINGGSVSRTRPQKAFRLSAKNKYGSSVMKYRFFPDKNIDEFKSLVLRNASGDWNKAHFRDGCIHKLLVNNTDIDVMSYRPAAIFLNGEYWGVLNIRERVSENYLKENYHIEEGVSDILEEDNSVIEGSFDEFNDMLDFVTHNDMSVQQWYDSASAMIDIPSLCDYYIAETFFSNIDWPYNNIKFWKEHGPGHKWRYLLIDLDIAFGNNLWAPASMDVLGRILGPYGDANIHVQIFKSLLKNTGFRNYFINRYADLINTLLSVDRLTEHIEATQENIAEEMPLHFLVWGNSIETWYYEIDSIIMPYIKARPAFAMQQIQDTFHLLHQTELTLDVWPAAGGSIRLNTIQPEPYPWKGLYFDGVPVTLTAIPNDGFSFYGWKTDEAQAFDMYSSTITFNPDTARFLTAYFKNDDTPSAVFAYPNPAVDQVNIGCILMAGGSGLIQLVDASGRVVYSESSSLLPGPNTLTVPTVSLDRGFYLICLYTPDGPMFSRLILSK